jgi:hypothetical protein
MATKKPETMGSMIDGIWALREKKRALNAQVETVEKEIAEKEEALIERMDKEGIDKSTGKLASVGVSEVTAFNIKDFDAVFAWAVKNKAQHVFQRRVSDVACREVFEMGKAIPGLEPFKKRKLNIRTLSQ